MGGKWKRLVVWIFFSASDFSLKLSAMSQTHIEGGQVILAEAGECFPSVDFCLKKASDILLQAELAKKF
jgi:hypothetical protein